MNKKGQALVEFIIILPVMIFIGFMFLDFMLISYNKQKLENIIIDVGEMYKNDEEIEEINSFISKNEDDVVVSFKDKDKYFEVKLVKDYEFITPGIQGILKDFEISVERTMYYE